MTTAALQTRPAAVAEPHPSATTAAENSVAAEHSAATEYPADTEFSAAATLPTTPEVPAPPHLFFGALPAASEEAPTAGIPGMPRPPADTIRYRTVAPAELFGPRSERCVAACVQKADVSRNPLRTGPAGTMALFVLLAYGMLLYRHPGDVRHLVGSLFNDRSAESQSYEETAGGYPRFLTLCTALGLVVLGVAAVRFGAFRLPERLFAELPRTTVPLGILCVTAALGCVQLYRFGLLACIGALTFSRPLTERLWFVKRRMLALATLLATPPLFMLLLTPPATNRFWFWVIIIVLFVSVVLYLRETLVLFLSKKVSILHWFLYLCIVEIFPLSFCILLAERSLR